VSIYLAHPARSILKINKKRFSIILISGATGRMNGQDTGKMGKMPASKSLNILVTRCATTLPAHFPCAL
jgi:hypothetical protein